MTMVLVVEDNRDIANLFAMVLREEGFEAEIAGTGAAALGKIARADLVIMDLSLPDMNGVEVAEHARKAGYTMPIIAVSGAMPLIDLAQIEKAHFFATVAKPARMSCIIDLVKRALNKE